MLRKDTVHLQRALIILPSGLIPATGPRKRPLVAEKGIIRTPGLAPHLDLISDEIKWRVLSPLSGGLRFFQGGRFGNDRGLI